MHCLRQDAERVHLLFQYGVLDGNSVVAWADAAIVQMESPPQALLELSTTTVDRTADFLSYLGLLGAGADLCSALRSAMPSIRDFVAARPDQAERIARCLFFSICRIPQGDVPDDFAFIYRSEDAFCLARDGSFGTFEAAYRDFLNELGGFTPVA